MKNFIKNGLVFAAGLASFNAYAQDTANAIEVYATCDQGRPAAHITGTQAKTIDNGVVIGVYTAIVTNPEEINLAKIDLMAFWHGATVDIDIAIKQATTAISGPRECSSSYGMNLF